MHPFLMVGLVLLGLTVVMALVGTGLVKKRVVRVKNAARYTQVCTLLLCVCCYALTHTSWPGVHLNAVDFWSLLLILAIVGYSAVWASVAYMLNKPEFQQEFGESFMFSMLYTDSQTPTSDFPATKVVESKMDSKTERKKLAD